MNLSKVSRETKRIFRTIDWEMKNVPKVCAEGCSACCYQPVTVLGPEGYVVERFIEDNFTSEEKARAKAAGEQWLSVFDRVTRTATVVNPLTEEEFDTAQKEVTALRAPCLFLRNDRCMVYEARPSVCRTYAVNDDPKFCEADPFRLISESAHKVRLRFNSQLRGIGPLLQRRPLVYAVAEVLGITSGIKPIKMHVRARNPLPSSHNV